MSYIQKVRKMENIKKTQLKPLDLNTRMFGMKFTLDEIYGRLDIQKIAVETIQTLRKKKNLNNDNGVSELWDTVKKPDVGVFKVSKGEMGDRRSI